MPERRAGACLARQADAKLTYRGQTVLDGPAVTDKDGPMATIFIDGEAGTTGLHLATELRATAGVELISLTPDRRRDPGARRDAMGAADLIVLCLPDDAAREAVAMMPEAARVVDASSAFRVATGWTYGFPELAPDQPAAIASARRVSNPGCYPTGAIALLRPLVDAGLIPPDHPISVNAVSGYSGGGKAMIAAHERDGGPAFELYALGLTHKHVAELQTHSGLTRRPIFVPSVGHFAQGMLVSIPLHLDTLPGRPTLDDLRATLAARYGAPRSGTSGRVRVTATPADGKLEPEALNGTGDLELFVAGNTDHRHAVLLARLDNLGKGASLAAVQNIALMLGL